MKFNEFKTIAYNVSRAVNGDVLEIFGGKLLENKYLKLEVVGLAGMIGTIQVEVEILKV